MKPEPQSASPADARVADLMTGPAPIVPSHLSMAAARKIATLKSVACLMVEAAGRVIGILDQRALTIGRGDDLVSTRMTGLTLAVRPTTTAARAHELLVQKRVAWLPVVAGMFVVGTVSRQALDRALAPVSDHATCVANVAA
jgi:CBS domain-containing protein